MFSCPYCEYTLTGRYSKVKDKDTCEIIIDCKNCSAILRIMITTLKDPDKKRLEKNRNLPQKPVKEDKKEITK